MGLSMQCDATLACIYVSDIAFMANEYVGAHHVHQTPQHILSSHLWCSVAPAELNCETPTLKNTLRIQEMSAS